MNVCWTHIITVWSCALVGSQLIKTAAACDRCPSHMPVSEMNVHTSVSTMAQMPRMPRIANTSRLWSVTAYARTNRRPADTVNNSLSRRRDALPWMPTRGAMMRAFWKWSMALHVLIHYKLLLQSMCFTHYNYVIQCVNGSHKTIPELMWN